MVSSIVCVNILVFNNKLFTFLKIHKTVFTCFIFDKITLKLTNYIIYMQW